MVRYFVHLFCFVCLTTAAIAQQPRWELFFPNISGPIAVDPTDSDIIYVAGDSCYNCANIGMWKTVDGGQTWNFYDEGWGMGRPADILINPDNPQEILVGGAPFVAVQKSTDGGRTWVRASYGIRTDHHGYDVRQLAYDRRNRIYYLADQGGGAFCGIYRSIDGINWELATPPSSCPLSVILDESNGDLYVGGAPHFWTSADGGKTWERRNNGFPPDTVLPITDPIVRHVAKVKGSRTLYCVVDERGILKTLDDGENWFSVNDTITNQLVFNGGLVVADNDSNTIFAGAQATLDSMRPGGSYVSRNGGKSWELTKYGLPDSAIDVAAFQPFLDTRSNTLYISMTLLFGPSQEVSNIYRMSEAIITNVDEARNIGPKVQLALSNYPNPFNSETSLLYSVPRAERIRIRIYNILGKEVIRLLEEVRKPGEYRIHWNGTDHSGNRLPSGIYLARMQIGQDMTTIKLLLLK